MMVEVEGSVDVSGSTVKIDTSEELNNLYEIARRARHTNNSEDAKKYYDLIQMKDPSSWEAAYYSVYYKAASCKIGEIASAAYSVGNVLPTVIDMINKSDTDKESALCEVISSTVEICWSLFLGAKNHYERFFDSHGSRGEMDDRKKACRITLTIWKTCILDSHEVNINSSEKVKRLVIKSYETAQEMWVDDYNIMYKQRPAAAALYEKNFQTLIDLLESDYILPIKPEHQKPVLGGTVDDALDGKIAQLICEGRRVEAIKIVRETKNIGLVEAKEYVDYVDGRNPVSSQKSGGCYVATCVYGSYDCPEVWTLRRFRDYDLAETWYGRAFIHTYYAISPTLVKWFGHTDWFKNMWRGTLNKMVHDLQEKGYENTPYQDRDWK